jgi:tetratricopeptide (TPR) repeat protein
MATPALSEADSICDQAKSLLRDRKYDEARKLYEQALIKDSRNIPAHEGLAAAAFVLKDFETAAAHFKKLSMLDVRRAEPLINLGAVYNRMGDFSSAARTLRQAISKDRKSAAAYYNLGIAYKGQNQQSQAISAYKEAIRLDPTMAESHQNLGNLYFDMGNFQSAIMHFEKALALNSKFEKARKGLERARNAQEEAKRTQNPFGRLVDESDVSRRQQTTSYRDLSAQERFEDRQTLHLMAKEAEQLAVAVKTQIREELAPALLRLQQTSAQPDDVRALYREAEQMTRFAARFSAVADAMRTKTDTIREHEKVVRG